MLFFTRKKKYKPAPPRFNAIYVMNISAQSVMAREIFPQMMIYLQFLAQIINIKARFPFNCPLPLERFNNAMKLSTFIESLLISIQ